jgi:hypothetical protein
MLATAVLLLSLSLSQVPCTPADSTVVCDCKQLKPGACEVLEEADPKLYQQVLRLLWMAKASKEAAKAGEKDQSATATSGCPEPPERKECDGQEHHAISKRVWKALEDHRLLRGHYRYRDSRFVTQAANKEAHCGYINTWHEALDEEIVIWIEKNQQVTPKQFEAWLRWRYSQPDLKWRFPNGL